MPSDADESTHAAPTPPNSPCTHDRHMRDGRCSTTANRWSSASWLSPCLCRYINKIGHKDGVNSVTSFLTNLPSKYGPMMMSLYSSASCDNCAIFSASPGAQGANGRPTYTHNSIRVGFSKGIAFALNCEIGERVHDCLFGHLPRK